MSEFVVGSRGSALALAQTRQVVDQLSRLHPDAGFRVEIIKTQGDRITDVALAKIGEKGLFVKEIEAALLNGSIGFAVHSAKDLPSETDSSLVIAAFPERENPADVLVSNKGRLFELPDGAVVGTSSVRRKAQLLAARQCLDIVDLRGNLDTRLRKLAEGCCDAIVLAYAGLKRMGWQDRATEVLSYDVCLPAAGQGAIALQCRKGQPVAEMLGALDHSPTRRCVSAERALLRGLSAGCQTPIGALAEETDGRIVLRAVVASLDGLSVVRDAIEGDSSRPEEIGELLAQRLLDSPAGEILEEVRRSAEPKTTGAA